jgi:hypothetical protein
MTLMQVGTSLEASLMAAAAPSSPTCIARVAQGSNAPCMQVNLTPGVCHLKTVS